MIHDAIKGAIFDRDLSTNNRAEIEHPGLLPPRPREGGLSKEATINGPVPTDIQFPAHLAKELSPSISLRIRFAC